MTNLTEITQKVEETGEGLKGLADGTNKIVDSLGKIPVIKRLVAPVTPSVKAGASVVRTAGEITSAVA